MLANPTDTRALFAPDSSSGAVLSDGFDCDKFEDDFYSDEERIRAAAEFMLGVDVGSGELFVGLPLIACYERILFLRSVKLVPDEVNPATGFMVAFRLGPNGPVIRLSDLAGFGFCTMPALVEVIISSIFVKNPH